jgi:hypothetical protein
MIKLGLALLLSASLSSGPPAQSSKPPVQPRHTITCEQIGPARATGRQFDCQPVPDPITPTGAPLGARTVRRSPPTIRTYKCNKVVETSIELVSPAACTPASRARAASVLGRPSRDASGEPHGAPIIPVGLSTLARKFTTVVNSRGVAIVNVEKPVTAAAPSISWKILRNVGRTGLIGRYGTHDQPPTRSRHASTHTFSSDGKDHIPAGDLHSDRAGIHTPRPPRISHCGPASGKTIVRTASVYIETSYQTPGHQSRRRPQPDRFRHTPVSRPTGAHFSSCAKSVSA